MPILTQQKAHHIIDYRDTSSISFDSIDPDFEAALIYEIKLLKATGFYPMLDIFMQAVDIIISEQTSWVICNFDPLLVKYIKQMITTNQKRVLTKLIISHDVDECKNYEWNPPVTPSVIMEVGASDEKKDEADDSGSNTLTEADLLELEEIRQLTSREVSFSAIASANNSFDESRIEQLDETTDNEFLEREFSDACSPLAEPSMVRSRSLATTSRSSSATSDSSFSLNNSTERYTLSPAVSPLNFPAGKIGAQILLQTLMDLKKAIASEKIKINESKKYRQNGLWINGFSRMYADRQISNNPAAYPKKSFDELESLYDKQQTWYAETVKSYLAAETETQNYINFLTTEIDLIEDKYLSVSCPQSFFYRLGPKASASSPQLSDTIPAFKL